MAPDLLIIGEPGERQDLLGRVERFGYRAVAAAASTLARHLDAATPAAILLSARGVEVGPLLAELRRDPQGLGIPVILYSELGGAIRDLADVLELGADRFLVAPVDDDELRAALVEVLGPCDPTPLGAPRPAGGDALPLRQRDPLLAQLRRTLAALDERAEAAAGGEAEVLDLDAIGLGGADELDLDDTSGFGELTDLEVELATRRVLRPAATLRLDEGERGAPSRREPTLADATRPVAARAPSPPIVTEPLAARAPTPTPTVATDALGGQRGPATRRPLPGQTATDATRRHPGPASARGRLADEPAPALLARLGRERFSGRLVLRGDAVIEITWREGQIIDARGDRPRDRLVAGLRRRGLVDDDVADALDRRLPEALDRAIDALVEAGHLKPEEAARARDEHLSELACAAFAWEDGSWSLHPEAPSEGGIGLGRPLAEVILEGARLELEEALLRRRLGADDRCPRARADAALAELPPPPGLADARALVDGRQRIADLAAIGGQPLLAWIYALVVLDRVDLVEAPVDDRSAIDRRRIRARSAAARAGDYFALLGLPITASRAEIRRALTELGRTFADERLEPATRSALAGELAELRAGLAEARDVLLDDGLRAAYLAHREGEQ